MADEPRAGGSPFDDGGGPEAGQAVGRINVNSRAAIDSSAFKELNKEFKTLNASVTKFKQDLPKLIEDTKKWATELGKVAKQMKAIGESKGGGGGAYMQGAGELTGGGNTSVASGNAPQIYKSITINEAPGGGGPGDGTGGRPSTWGAIAKLAGAAINAMDARAARGAQYSLSADKMNMLYQQTTGLSQNQVYHQYREPLQPYKLGMGGINELLGLQARTGLNAQRQAGSVEAMRALSGYAYDTSQIVGMTQALATPGAANQMFMMLGTGMYGIGGKQRTQQQVFQDVIKRTGLTNEKMVQSAFQQGSMTRARLEMSGMAEDQIDLLLQYAQSNVAYKKKGGQGFYDPSKKAQRELMGVEGNYANQAEETQRVKAVREENFYKRQNDNFATFEKATQSATKALQMFEEKLSTIVGANISTKPYQNTFKSAMKWGTAIGGILLAGPTGGASLLATGAALGMGGDPVFSRPRRGRIGLGGDATTGGDEKQLSANNKQKLAQLDARLREPLKQMLLANPRLEIGDAKRSAARQESSFKKRYSKAPAGTTKKTKDADRMWNGEVWIYDKHAEDGPPMAPPGQSMHEIGLAADLSQSENEWIRANAEKFGLVTGATTPGAQTDEPFHVQPASVPFGRGEQPGSGGMSGTDTGEPASVTTSSGSSGAGTKATKRGRSYASASYVMSTPLFQSSGLSMGEVIGTGSHYAKVGASFTSSSSAGGDPITSRGGSVGPSNSYTITVSPQFQITSNLSSPNDFKKLAKDVAEMLEQEVKLTMMRMS